jgi:exodeoxyribonuclease VII large subunit
VLTHVELRAPGMPVRVVAVPVQGPQAAAAVIGAVRTLDADPDVEVIVLARGGGSVEDLLPFSDEGLVRAVAACRTPVVTAIGHEQDRPLVDLAADLRASTPTDAAKRVVPDIAAEREAIASARARTTRALQTRLAREAAAVAAVRARPVLADPGGAMLGRRRDAIREARDRLGRGLHQQLRAERTGVAHRREQVRALSPAATLARGYAVAQRVDGTVVRAPQDVTPGEVLRLRVTGGSLTVRVIGEATPDEA